jgi:hypothetical protein
MTDLDDLAKMKPDELHPCSKCDGLLTGKEGRDIQFYVVDVGTAVLDRQAIRDREGLAMILGGSAALAEVFAPTSTVATIVPGKRLLLCFDCYATLLAGMVEG